MSPGASAAQRSRIADPWVIVPVRGIGSGKSRLAGVLGPAARATLNRWLLEKTLGAIAAWRGGCAACVVVSPCDEALDIARRAGAHAVREPHADGFSEAARLGTAHAAGLGAQSVLVLPCDLPGLTAESLQAFAAGGACARCIRLAPDRAERGTNALLAGVGFAPRFAFGPGSFARHATAAVEQGLDVEARRQPELAFDLDTPADLRAWRAGEAAITTTS